MKQSPYIGDHSRLSLKKDSPRRLTIPSLAIINFTTQPLGVLLSLLLIDISLTFKISVGIMGQVSTLSSIVAVISGLFTGILSVQFRHKKLLIMGLLCLNISALGCVFASEFNLMLISYSLSGVGIAMVFPMIMAIVGEHFSLNERGNAVGWIVAAASLSYVIGSPVISFLADIQDWRFAILGFVIPVSVVSLFLAVIGVPSKSSGRKIELNKEVLLKSFKAVLVNRSASACLLGNILRAASFVAVLLYGVSFFRQQFTVSTDFASIIILGGALCYTVGSLFAGWLVNKVGRKLLTVLTTLFSGIAIISYVYMTPLWFSLGLYFVGAWFSGMGYSAATSLALEQIPELRATMMSINTAAISLGSSIGSAVGGLVLVLFNYEALMSTLGLMGIIGGIIFYLFAIDRTADKRMMKL